MIELRNVTKIYKSKKASDTIALNDISLKFPDKGLVFVLGSSGSGKSTLLNLLGLLDKPTNGEILVNGTNINKMSDKLLTRYRNNYIGFIFQEFNLFDELNVYDNIELCINVKNVLDLKGKIDNLLNDLGLSGYGKRKINELSGGEKGRVAIARAIIKSPSVILADEPTGNLDSENSKIIFDILKKISKNHLVIVVSHEEALAQIYADAIVRLEDGKIIQNNIGNVNSIYRELSLKKHYIKFSSKVKLALGILKKKKIRTGITAILASIAFALLGFSMSLFNFDVARMHSEAMIYENETNINFSKGNFNTNNINLNMVLTDSDVLEITNKLDNYQKISYLYTNNSIENFSFGMSLDFVNELEYSAYYNIDLNSTPYFVTYSKDDMNDLDIIGNVPNNPREVLIPEYFAEQLVAKSFNTYDEDRNYPIYQMEVDSINELIGKNLSLSSTYVTISGIIKDYNLSKYKDLINKDIQDEEYKESNLYKEFASNYNNSVYFVINDEFFKNSDFASNNTISNTVFNLANIYNNDNYYLATNYSVIDKEIEYYDGANFVKSNSLNDNEVIVSQMFLEDYYGSDLTQGLMSALVEAREEYDKLVEERNKLLEEQMNNCINYGICDYEEIPEVEQIDINELTKNYYIDYMNDHGSIIGNLYTLQIKDETHFTDKEINNIDLKIVGVVFEDIINYINYNTIKDYILPNELVISIKTNINDEDKLEQLFNDFSKKSGNYKIETKFSEKIKDVEGIVESIEDISIYLVVGASLFAIILFTLFISASISNYKKNIGLLRALGARIKEIVNIFILESLIIGIITFILANILAILSINIVNNYITKEVYFYLRPLVFNENTIFIILISIIGVILISLIIPIVHLSKKRPINLINE